MVSETESRVSGPPSPETLKMIEVDPARASSGTVITAVEVASLFDVWAAFRLCDGGENETLHPGGRGRCSG